MPVQQGGQPGLLRGLVAVDRQVHERDAEEGAGRRGVGVVADDEREVGDELAGAVPGQQVEQAVLLLADQQRDPGEPLGEAQLHLHREGLADLAEGVQDAVVGEVEAVELELDPLEEQPLVVVGVLVDLDDVGAVAGQELRHGRDDARARPGRSAAARRSGGRPSGAGTKADRSEGAASGAVTRPTLGRVGPHDDAVDEAGRAGAVPPL